MRTLQSLICLFALVYFSHNSIAQTITFSGPGVINDTLTQINIPSSFSFLTVSGSGVPNITVSVSGFAGLITYRWSIVSFTKVFGSDSDPEILHDIDGPTSPIFPSTTSPSTIRDVEFWYYGPGTITYRICATTAINGTVCRNITLILRPPVNVSPIITWLDDPIEKTLPIANTDSLRATISDPTDRVNYSWSEITNPMTIPNLPPNGLIQRGVASFKTGFSLGTITKPGNYTFRITATDDRGESNSTTISNRTFLVKPAASSLGINITPPGVAPDPNVLITPVNNVPLNSQITGINVFNDRIRYFWTQIAGTTSITLPPPAYTANVNDLPVASSTFNVPPLNLNALAYGTYTLRLRAEDEYYPGTFVEQDITFQVRPPESNLDVTVNPSAVTTIDPYSNFNFNGRVTGINAGSDVIRTYWRQDAGNPVQLSVAPFNETFTSPNVVPIGTTELTSNATLSSRITAGRYIFWYVARDIFYNVADSAKVEIVVEPGRSTFAVSIDPSGEKSITKTPDGWIFNVGENPQNVSFNVTGRTTGISDKTDFVRTYWRMSFTPDASGETQNPTLPHTFSNPKEIPLATTTDESVLGFTLSNAAPGEYDIWYVARDLFYNTADSANLKLLIRRPVQIQPLAAFTPNGDGFNDVWTIRNIESFPDVGVKIVNERGELVFETNSVAQLPERGWDGRRRDGKLASEGAYYYQFFDNRDQTLITAGSFIILR